MVQDIAIARCKDDYNTLAPQIDRILRNASNSLLSLQSRYGYWWFTLEANESIGAEFIFLMYFLEDVDNVLLKGIAKRILDVQKSDGSWPLYSGGAGDLSTTVECYIALKLAGYDINNDKRLIKAREFILANGGAENSRVFTLIHLALFGWIPWKACPELPAEFIMSPTWQPFNIYEFSSWARTTIVPLLIVGTLKPVRKLNLSIDEIFKEKDSKRRKYKKPDIKNPLTLEYFFLKADKVLKGYASFKSNIVRKKSIEKCLSWLEEHSQVEDIFPALAYATIAYKSLGYPNNSKEIQKPFTALKMFQQGYEGSKLPFKPAELPDDGKISLAKGRLEGKFEYGARQAATIHQQCCISPAWDTPWSIIALIEAGVSPSHPALLKAGHWLLLKQITKVKGDWAIKNPEGKPGGWSFEFENDLYPDTDDTIAITTALYRLSLSEKDKGPAIQRAVDWLLSMQNDDGGWAAFDKNNCREWVNKIPFSDHKACLDPSSPDITGRMIELFAILGMAEHEAVARAIKYIKKNQERDGSWFARWGINYLYGTWCVTTGLSRLGIQDDIMMRKAARWLLSIQNSDGGFGESPESYSKNTFVPANSCPSQTAWGLMALSACGLSKSEAAYRAVRFLVDSIDENGLWSEENYTGTGFPGHFYIRYHGYPRYFPLLALARWREQSFNCHDTTPKQQLVYV